MIEITCWKTVTISSCDHKMKGNSAEQQNHNQEEMVAHAGWSLHIHCLVVDQACRTELNDAGQYIDCATSYHLI